MAAHMIHTPCTLLFLSIYDDQAKVAVQMFHLSLGFLSFLRQIIVQHGTDRP